MRYRDFLGRKTSVLCMGSVGLGFDFSQKQTNEILDAYVNLGGNFIDTARVYGDFAGGVCGVSERAIGNWLAARHNREKMILGTKGGHPELSTMNVGRLDRENLSADIRRSLDDLMVDQVDIYWLHRDDVSRPVGDILETLNGFLQAGYTRFIGVSNWTTARIREANAYAAAHGMTGFCANQPQFSLARQEVVEDPHCARWIGRCMIFTWKRACPACRFLPRPRAFSSSCTTARQCPTRPGAGLTRPTTRRPTPAF